MTISSVIAAQRQEKEKKQKNVLLLMSDEHSGRVMGSAGNPIIKTPSLDALAASGVLFRSAYCQNPACVPSRASLVTGQMPSKLGVFDNKAHQKNLLQGTPVTLARTFTNAGYTAEWLGKEHWGTSNKDLGFGKENKVVYERIRTKCQVHKDLRKKVGVQPQQAQPFGKEIKPLRDVLVADGAIDWLNDYDGTKPFFLGVSLVNPHFPYMVLREYYNMYKNVIDLPRVAPKMIEELPYVNKKEREMYGWGNMTTEQTKIARAVYYGMISFADELFGRVIRKLEEKGLREDTIIVYLSDHGEFAGEHGLWYKNSFYEDSAIVPLIFSFPQAIPVGTQINSPVQLMDVFPTLCELCNITIPEEIDGKSLMPIVRGDERGWRRHAISENYRFGSSGRMVRKGPWKYCWYEDGENELFNLKEDPAEEKNLYKNPKYAKKVKLFHKLAMKSYIEVS